MIPEPPKMTGDEWVHLEDLSNALNGALAQVGMHLRKHNFTGVQIEEICNDCLEEGIRQMREKQVERIKNAPMVKVVQ